MCWEQRIAYYPCVFESHVCYQKFDCGLQENWGRICVEQVISTLPSHAEREKTDKRNPQRVKTRQETFMSKSSRGSKQKEKSTELRFEPGTSRLQVRAVTNEPSRRWQKIVRQRPVSKTSEHSYTFSRYGLYAEHYDYWEFHQVRYTKFQVPI